MAVSGTTFENDIWRAGGQLEGEIELLRRIDQQILEIDKNTAANKIEGLFTKSISDFKHIYQHDLEYLFLVYMGPTFKPLRRNPSSPPETVDYSDCKALGEFVAETVRSQRLLAPNDDAALFRHLEEPQAILVAPIYTSSGKLLGTLLVAARTEADLNLLNESVFTNGIAALVAQLTIAYSHFERASFNVELERLWEQLLAQNLSPTICFKIIAERVVKFLPTFGPLKRPAAGIQAQVLMLARSVDDDRRSEHLVIRGDHW